MKCIVIDDEPLALMQPSDYISRVPFLSLIKSCWDAFEAMKILSEEEIDLISADTNMPDSSGLDFIRSSVNRPLVIFTTTYSEHAVEGFKLDVVDYLLKPFESQDLLKAADKAHRQLEYRLLEQQGKIGDTSQIKGDSLFVKSNYRVACIGVRNIHYTEGMNRCVRVFVEGEDKLVIVLANLQKMEERFLAYFTRAHRSHIANLRRITEVSRLRTIFGKSACIPADDNYKEKFTEYIGKLSLS